LQSGATRQALTRSQIAQFQIPLPDTILQERIMSYLDSIQEGVDELQDMLREDEEILKQVEQGILDQAFRGEL
jgi:restriction endonuclease S subunit